MSTRPYERRHERHHGAGRFVGAEPGALIVAALRRRGLRVTLLDRSATWTPRRMLMPWLPHARPPGGSPARLRPSCRDALPGDTASLGRCAGRTLDVGYGPGRLASALLGLGQPALGIDISAVAVRLVRRHSHPVPHCRRDAAHASLAYRRPQGRGQP